MGAIAGVGTIFYRWSGTDWDVIAEVRAIIGPSINKDTINVTSLETEIGYNEFISGFANGGEVSLAMSFTRDTYELFKVDFEDKESHHYGIMLPDVDSTFFDFNGLLTELPLGIESDGKVDVNVKIKVTGILGLDTSETPTPSSVMDYTLSDFINAMSFWGDTFDFENNLWVDKSGNNNHATLKGASARTSSSGNLDYTITGVLTSDTIEVVTGSDTPTIPSNGVLRIAEGQVVYGVTIKRSGVPWAVIPFCEPMINENVPTISYDVSGNGHHAVCTALVPGNITTQDNYFYLLQYGYSLGGADLLLWDTSSWTGSIDDYDAIFSGVALGSAQSADSNIQPTSDGMGCLLTDAAGFNMKFRKYSAMVVGQRYRLKIRIGGFMAGGPSCGLQVGNLGFTVVGQKWLVGEGEFDMDGIAGNTTLEIGASSTTFARVIEFYDPTLQLLVIVPGLLTGVNDAVGNPIEFVQNGSTLLNYACTLQFSEGLVTADQKGYWSDFMNQGYCVAGKTYLIEKTETNHFGVGKVAFDEFIAVGTEELDDSNEVRELILHGTERGFFFDDDMTPHPRGYGDFVNIKPHFVYCDLPKTEVIHWYNSTTPGLIPPQFYDVTGYGWKEYKSNHKITNLIIIDPGIYFSDVEKGIFNSLFITIEEPTFGMVSFIYDSWKLADYQDVLSVYDARKVKLSRAIYYGDDVTQEQTDAVQASGHEICVHTPMFASTPLVSHKGFHDMATNYSEAELRQYYTDVVSYMQAQGYTIGHKVLPGGGSDILNQSLALDYFDAVYRAVSSEKVNRIPIITYQVVGRHGNDYVDSTQVTEGEAVIDLVVATKGWSIFYSHTYSFSEDSLTNIGVILDYIKAKTAAGEPIRTVKLADAYAILKKQK